MSRRFLVAAAAAVALLSPPGARADHVTATPTVTLETTGEYDPARFGTPAVLGWSILCAPIEDDTTYQGGFDLYSSATHAFYSPGYTDFFTLPQSGSQELMLEPGLAVYPHGDGAGCTGGTGIDVHSDHQAIDGDPLVIPPHVELPMLLDAEGGMYMDGTAPAGAELTAALVVADRPLGDEKITVVFEGAGVDFRQDFVDANAAASRGEVKFTPTENGILTHYVIKQPYAVESNRITIQIGTGGDGSGSGSGSSGGGKGGDSGGCAAGGGGLSLLGLLGLAGLRRRRAARS